MKDPQHDLAGILAKDVKIPISLTRERPDLTNAEPEELTCHQTRLIGCDSRRRLLKLCI
jgi:hypothetical protein